MDTTRARIARWVMDNRVAMAVAFVAVTVFFAIGMRGVEFRTVFSDLLPKDDPFVQVYKDHPNFGDPLTMTIMVRRTDGGTIYNTDTLQKVWDLTRDIDLAPGVDHDQILSITTEKARYAEATPYGIDMRPLMDDHVPETQEELEEFRRRIEQSPDARTFLVSADETATIINATFIERLLDYNVAFTYAQELVEAARDENHEVHLAGQPALTGWVFRYQMEMRWIFGVTLGALVLALILYMRNVVGVVTPIVCSTVAAIWGLGLVGWMSSPIEPLLMVVPLLLVARSFSHCVQFTERYYEVYAKVKDKRKACEMTMSVMMAPSILGIITDTAGIVLIAVAPIPAMERFALFAGFWSIAIIPTGVFLISIMLSWLPAPKNVEKLTGRGNESKAGIHARFRDTLSALSSLTNGKRGRITAGLVAVLAVVSTYTALQIRIGNPVEGSPLLWDDSEFNVAVRQINDLFPGVNTLEIILEARDSDPDFRVARLPETAATALRIQSIVEAASVNGNGLSPRATLSFADYMMEGNRLFSGGNPKWLPLDFTEDATNAAANAITFGSNPKNFSHIVDFEFQNSTVSLWYRDNTQETIRAALASARKAIDEVGVEHEHFIVRLGSGTIALEHAVNDVVARYHWVVLGLLNLVILLVASIAYKSPVAGIILLLPVNFANMLLTSVMHLLGIGLDINSMMVAVIGIGVGIDYGIYLLSRICEEYNLNDGDWAKTMRASLTTTGKAIMFTATIMLIGILPWYFLSPIKFMADMGLLLVSIMLINMVLALVVLPLLVWLINPKFVGRDDLMVGEALDFTGYTAGHRPAEAQ